MHAYHLYNMKNKVFLVFKVILISLLPDRYLRYYWYRLN
jgi:hypothetical protein